MKPLALAALSTILAAPLPGPAANPAAGAAGAGAGAAPAQQRPSCANCGVVASIRRTELDRDARWMDASAEAARNPKDRGSPREPGSAVLKTQRPSARAGTDEANQAARDGEVGPRRRTVYEVVIRLDDGKTRKMHYEHRPALKVGDKVRVSRGQVYLR